MGAQQLSEILTKLDSWLDAYQLYAQAHPAIVQVWALETSKNSDLDDPLFKLNYDSFFNSTNGGITITNDKENIFSGIFSIISVSSSTI